MSKKISKSNKSSKSEPKLGRLLWEDLHRGGIKRTLRQDFRDIYHFYIDRKSRKQLKSMGRIRRWIRIAYWILRSLILKLTPARRVLLVASLIVFFSNNPNVRLLGFLTLLLILMFELKDKLLARDELEAGRVVQFALIPDENPALSGWDIWLFTRPANEVGGDLVDYLKIDDNRLGITLGDVAGKGLGAALFMAKLQATFRALAPSFSSLNQLAVEMNRIFCRDGLPERFVSLVYLELEPDSGKVHLLNAGHLPPLAIRSGKLKELSRGGPALGILPKATYEEQHIDLQPGDLLFVYSDGITESQNEQGEFFGERHLQKLLTKWKNLPSEKIGTRVLEEVDVFIGDARPSDDVSLVILKRK